MTEKNVYSGSLEVSAYQHGCRWTELDSNIYPAMNALRSPDHDIIFKPQA